MEPDPIFGGYTREMIETWSPRKLLCLYINLELQPRLHPKDQRFKALVFRTINNRPLREKYETAARFAVREREFYRRNFLVL
jgi:hypothetical protein